MRAGSLKYRLELYRPGYTKSGTGYQSISYQLTCTAWAERRKLTGSRSDEVGEHFEDFRAVWLIRDAHPVEAHWRVKQVGTDILYEVTSVEPNLDRGYKTLNCERVNE